MFLDWKWSIPLWCVAEVQSSCSLVCFSSSSSWFFTPNLEVFPTSRKKFWKLVLAFLIMSIGDSLTHQIYSSPDTVFKLESLKSCDFLYWNEWWKQRWHLGQRRNDEDSRYWKFHFNSFPSQKQISLWTTLKFSTYVHLQYSSQVPNGKICRASCFPKNGIDHNSLLSYFLQSMFLEFFFSLFNLTHYVFLLTFKTQGACTIPFISILEFCPYILK